MKVIFVIFFFIPPCISRRGERNRVRGDFQLSFMLYAFLRGTLSSLISRKLIDGPAWNETHCSQRCVLLLSCMGITCFVNSEILFGRVPRSTRLLRTTSLGSVSAHTFFFFFFFLFFFFLFFFTWCIWQWLWSSCGIKNWDGIFFPLFF